MRDSSYVSLFRRTARYSEVSTAEISFQSSFVALAIWLLLVYTFLFPKNFFCTVFLLFVLLIYTVFLVFFSPFCVGNFFFFEFFLGLMKILNLSLYFKPNGFFFFLNNWSKLQSIQNLFLPRFELVFSWVYSREYK